MGSITPQERNKIAKAISDKLSLRSEMELVVEKNRTLGTLEWGKRNSRPSYLVALYDGQPQHADIVKGKAKYLIGTNIKGSTPFAEEWLKRANPKESFQDLRTKYLGDYTLYGGYTIKVVPNAMGVPLWFFHMPFGQHQISECRTEVKFCKDWTKWRQEGVETYPIWHPGCTEVSVYRFANYKPVAKDIDGAYPALEYESGLKSIDTLKRIQNYKNSLVTNNFSSGAVVTIFGGKPDTQTQEQEIADRIKGEHTGDEKAGNIVVLFADPGDTPADVKNIQPSDLDKQFESVTKTETINVYAAHNAPADLFNYVSDTAQVFDVNKIVEQNELFMNTYVVPTQKPELKMLAELFQLRSGQPADFEIEQFKPIGLNLLDPNLSKYLTNDEIRERLGLPLADKQVDNNANKVIEAINSLSPLVANKVLESMSSDEIRSLVGLSNGPAVVDPNAPAPIAPTAAPIQQVEVNDHLKNLTGKQTQGIMRIVRKFQNGEYSEVQAGLLLKSGFGLTDSQIKEFLGIQPAPAGQMPIQQRIAFSKEQDFLALFDKYAHKPVNDEVLETVYFTGRIEFSAEVDPKTRTAVLNKIKEDPEASSEDIATALGITVAAVASATAWLISKKLLAQVEGKLNVTEKGLKAKKTVIYTEYNYDKRQEVPGPIIKATTRDFCRQMYSKFKEGARALTFEAINNISNEFGMDAWSYRGGFWHDPQSGETEPFCRHIWKGTTKIRYE